jgi:hypothetical protein
MAIKVVLDDAYQFFGHDALSSLGSIPSQLHGPGFPSAVADARSLKYSGSDTYNLP